MEKVRFLTQKNILLLSCIFVFAFVTFWNTFSLALFGDDWLAFYRYRYHLGDWSIGAFNHISYFLTPYGSQDIFMGIISILFGFNSLPYYLVSLIFRLTVSICIYFIFYKITRSELASLLSSLLFAVTPIGLDATNWVFNMPSYTGLLFFGVFLYFFLESQISNSVRKSLLATFFYYVAFIFAPIRMHGVLPFALLMDLFLLLKTRSKTAFPVVMSRQVLLWSTFVFIRLTGYSSGDLGDAQNKLRLGFSYMSNSLHNSDFTFLLTPFVIVGRFFIPEQILTSIVEVLTLQPRFLHMIFVATLIFLPLFIIAKIGIKNIQNQKTIYIYVGSLILWVIVSRFILSTAVMKPIGLDVSVPALVGGSLAITMIFLAIIHRSISLSLLTFAGVLWMFVSFFFPYLWSPNSYLATTHRYLIVAAFGFAMVWGSLTQLMQTRAQKVYASIVFLTFIFIHALVTQNFFEKLIPQRGVVVTKNVWETIPDISKNITNEAPHLYYFEGNQGIIYHVITFGFPPHIALLYNVHEGTAKLPIPVNNWNEVITAVTTGENLAAYGYPKEPLPIENIHAFKVMNDGTIEDITPNKIEAIQNETQRYEKSK